MIPTIFGMWLPRSSGETATPVGQQGGEPPHDMDQGITTSVRINTENLTDLWRGNALHHVGAVWMGPDTVHLSCLVGFHPGRLCANCKLVPRRFYNTARW